MYICLKCCGYLSKLSELRRNICLLNRYTTGQTNIFQTISLHRREQKHVYCNKYESDGTFNEYFAVCNKLSNIH